MCPCPLPKHTRSIVMYLCMGVCVPDLFTLTLATHNCFSGYSAVAMLSLFCFASSFLFTSLRVVVAFRLLYDNRYLCIIFLAVLLLLP